MIDIRNQNWFCPNINGWNTFLDVFEMGVVILKGTLFSVLNSDAKSRTKNKCVVSIWNKVLLNLCWHFSFQGEIGLTNRKKHEKNNQGFLFSSVFNLYAVLGGSSTFTLFWCCLYFTLSVSPDHSGGGPSPIATHPYVLLGLVTDAERSSDIVPVSQSSGSYHISLDPIHSLKFILNSYFWLLRCQDYPFSLAILQ